MTDNQKIIRHLRRLADAWEAGDVPQWLNRMGEWRDVEPGHNLDYIVQHLSDDELRIKPRPYVRFQNELRDVNGDPYLAQQVYYSHAEAVDGTSTLKNYIRTVRMVEAESDE